MKSQETYVEISVSLNERPGSLKLLHQQPVETNGHLLPVVL